ncbi:MAG: hypothetical protein ACK5S6_03615 [bacterium]|jgi:hypothetical protein
MRSGIDLIEAERRRQVKSEGWSAEHDDTHREGELAIEAALWATEQTARKSFRDGMCGPESHRQSKSRIRQLVIAGALIAAEIDRLQRLEVLRLSTQMAGDSDVDDFDDDA